MRVLALLRERLPCWLGSKWNELLPAVRHKLRDMLGIPFGTGNKIREAASSRLGVAPIRELHLSNNPLERDRPDLREGLDLEGHVDVVGVHHHLIGRAWRERRDGAGAQGARGAEGTRESRRNS